MQKDDAKAKGNPSVKGFLILSRLPFLSPGLASLITGIGIAMIDGYNAELGLIALSLVGLAMIMLATYYFNEYYEGDMINKTFMKFSGGSGHNDGVRDESGYRYLS